jgi:hypothetical protein
MAVIITRDVNVRHREYPVHTHGVPQELELPELFASLSDYASNEFFRQNLFIPQDNFKSIS